MNNKEVDTTLSITLKYDFWQSIQTCLKGSSFRSAGNF